MTGRETGTAYSSADFVAHAGIMTLIDGAHAIAHNKVMVIDGEKRQNAENLLVIRDKALAARYAENWQAHAAHSARYVGR